MDAKEFLSNPQYTIVSEQILKLIEESSAEELDNLHQEATELLNLALKEYNDAISIVEFRNENLVFNAIIEEKKVYIHSVDRFLDELDDFPS